MVGDPVAHSLSPRMHNAAIAALGIDAVYVGLRVGASGVAALVRSLVATGAGLNVTVPHKRAVAALLEDVPEIVRRTGACNTVWSGTGGLRGDNTDVTAVRAEAVRLMDGREARRALVVGTGGSACAAAVALDEAWPGVAVEVLSRDARRAEGFAAWAATAGITVQRPGGGAVEIIVNATPLGLAAADPLPLDLEHLRARGPAAVLDLVYVRNRTRLVRGALERGIAAEDGRGVLVAQGAEAFRRFFDVAAPVEVMRAAVEEALGG